MVKRNTPDWQISAFDKDNNSCVKTKPINKKIKELEAAYAKTQEIKAKVEDIDTSAFYLKEEPVKEEKDDKVKFTSVEPLRKDPNRGMRFVSCSEPINKGKLGSSRSFIKKRDREYY